MMADSGDIENPNPDADPPAPADATAAGASSSNPGDGANNEDPYKKWKVIALSTFLLAAVILAIALGVTLGNDSGTTSTEDPNKINPGENTDGTGPDDTITTTATCLVGDIMYQEGDSIGHIGMECINSTSYNGTASTCGPDGEVIETEMQFTCGGSVPFCVQCGPPGWGAALCLSTQTTDRDCGDDVETLSPSDAVVASPTLAPTEEEDIVAPQVYKAEYLVANGPIQSKVRIINPGVANGYASCKDMRDDIQNAIKHYANSIIVRESQNNNWYENCDPSNPSRPIYDMPVSAVAEESMMLDSKAPPTAGSEGGSGAKLKEDSFETNNQVDGVDEGDVVKSDGDYVYAAYGDLIYVWNASDATAGISITKMPYEENTDCSSNYSPPKPLIFVEEEVEQMKDPVDEAEELSSEEFEELTVELDELEVEKPQSSESTLAQAASSASTSNSSSGGNRRARHHHRKASMIAPWWNPCPKPIIRSLLLEGSRLTAIVSEEKYRHPWWYYEEGNEKKEQEPIIDDYTKLTIRIYDISSVPTNGGPLTLIGEKEIKGNYDSARSVGNTGFVITTSYVNTGVFANDLYRWQPQYCGLNSTEYEALAAETALNNTEPFMERMLDELQLQLDGTCDNMFQIAAMQSGDSLEDSTGGDMLSQFVQVLSFDMSSTNSVNEKGEIAKDISTDVAAAFSSGWLSSVYANQKFAATLNVGSSYNKMSGNWDQSTFILGFDINSATPKPFCYAEVPGQPLNKYSVDYYQDHLRVVTTETSWSGFTTETEDTAFVTNKSTTKNKIFILKVPEDGDENQTMGLIGKTDHIGKPDERVYSVRFIAEKAYIVTFKRIDPFYIFDLSIPAEPKKLGELEIPGYSSYLHPVEIDGVPLILGVGEQVDEETNRRSGVKISLFDVSDPGNPTENATFVEVGAYSSANSDFYAFRYLPLTQKLILPKSEYTGSWKGNFDGFVVYDIGLGTITPSYKVQHADSYNMYYDCWYPAFMPARSFVFQSKLTTMMSHSVISTDLEDGAELWNITLGEGVDTDCAPYFRPMM